MITAEDMKRFREGAAQEPAATVDPEPFLPVEPVDERTLISVALTPLKMFLGAGKTDVA